MGSSEETLDLRPSHHPLLFSLFNRMFSRAPGPSSFQIQACRSVLPEEPSVWVSQESLSSVARFRVSFLLCMYVPMRACLRCICVKYVWSLEENFGIVPLTLFTEAEFLTGLSLPSRQGWLDSEPQASAHLYLLGI